jgi:glutathione S-transferase
VPLERGGHRQAQIVAAAFAFAETGSWFFEENAAMAIRLHYHPLSTYSRRVRIALAEKQIPHELVVVDMPARRHREQPYLSLNPYGRVPTLEEDGFVLYESTAILGYLEATRPSPALAPADARGRALVDMHVKLCDLQFSRHAGIIMFPKRFLPKERWNASAMAEAKGEIEKHLVILDKQLAGKTFLVGEEFSLAEVCYIPFLDFLPLMEITPPGAVASWSSRLLARESAQATRAER